jgi:hypothetical protein
MPPKKKGVSEGISASSNVQLTLNVRVEWADLDAAALWARYAMHVSIPLGPENHKDAVFDPVSKEKSYSSSRQIDLSVDTVSYFNTLLRQCFLCILAHISVSTVVLPF